MSSKNYFENISNKWDEMRQGFFSDAVREKAISAAKLEDGKTGVDLGAGTGFITEMLIQKGLRVIAIDQSEEMLQVLRNKFSIIENLECRLGVAEKLPIEDNFVDYVFANMYLHHVEMPSLAIKETVRILRQGGKFIITDLDKHTHEFLRVEHHDRWLGFSRNDVQDWFVQAGLKNVFVNSINEQCCAQSECSNSEANVSIFLAYGEK